MRKSFENASSFLYSNKRNFIFAIALLAILATPTTCFATQFDWTTNKQLLEDPIKNMYAFLNGYVLVGLVFAGLLIACWQYFFNNNTSAFVWFVVGLFFLGAIKAFIDAFVGTL